MGQGFSSNWWKIAVIIIIYALLGILKEAYVIHLVDAQIRFLDRWEYSSALKVTDKVITGAFYALLYCSVLFFSLRLLFDYTSSKRYLLTFTFFLLIVILLYVVGIASESNSIMNLSSRFKELLFSPIPVFVIFLINKVIAKQIK